MKKRFGKSLSIRGKLILSFALILLLPAIFIGYFSYETAKSRIGNELIKAAQQNTSLLNQAVDQMISPKLSDANYLAQQPVIKNNNLINLSQLKDKFDEYQALHKESQLVYIGTSTGKFISSPFVVNPPDYDARKRGWYKDALARKGEVVISSPYVSASAKNMVITVSKALNDGSGVIGIDISLAQLGQTVKGVKIGNNGYVTMLDKEKNYLFNPTIEGGTAATGSYIDQMYASDSGEMQFTLQNKPKEMVFLTNPTTGWKLAGVMDSQEIQNEAAPIFNNMLVVILVFLVIGGIIIYFNIRSFTRPLMHLMSATNKISKGDLKERIEITSTDEFGKLSNHFNEMADSLHAVINEVSENTTQLAAYSEQLTASAEQNSKASEQIADVIQEVAVGSDNQVQTVEKTTEIIMNLSQNMKDIEVNSESLTYKAVETEEKSQQGNKAISTTMNQMSEINETVMGLSTVIKELGEHSEEIGKIIEVITNIAEQTNLLALNAAIEAARAGEHGRGFSVVADEVRKLAEQSGQSAQQIAVLVSAIQTETVKAVETMETTTAQVKEGIDVVNTAGKSFNDIQESIKEVTEQIKGISASMVKMSAETEDVFQSINLIKTVSEDTSGGMQNISASTEEQLASMQEITASSSSLSKMAENLQTLINKFTL
ncbi:methyl-accepting chemotaxis protein [Aneurinibacillus sp. Ricciae_BoGa-3]|uniref:methyl-accepting chemotaxis protein n=1 Tax=Aneurinibacillus sp. Ricciae_BoGa-3 TaxID=3022697 RepID=UPI0023425283|nr:methyl-accepting chemotaxis protein [Aneurinibacillus sp. Ricciae_BoGa-3]WCK54025.1 methyl-accepting chemotaxis protein [Aneurinibacillus sp. Ricciae_BoGa-3]